MSTTAGFGPSPVSVDPLPGAQPSASLPLREERQKLHSRFAQGIAWNLLSNVTSQGATFGTNVLVANILGRTAFGEYAMVSNTIASASLFGQCATGYTALKYLAEFRIVDKPRAGRVLALCSAISTASAFLIALACLLCAGKLAGLFRAPHLTTALRLGAGVLGFSVLNGFQMGVLQGLESYRFLCRANVYGACLSLFLCLTLAQQFGVNGALFGLLAGSVAKWIVFERFIGRELSLQGICLDYANMRQETHIFKRFGLPAALTGFAMAPSPWIANTLLVRQPGGFGQMAIYGAGMNMLTLVSFLPKVIDRVSMSLLNFEKGARNGAGYRRVVKLNLTLTLSCAVAGAICAAVFGPWFLRLFGKSFVADGYTTLLILLIAPVQEVVTSAFAQVIESHERMWTRALAVNLPRDLCFPIAAFLLVPRGASGLAVAYVLSQTVAFAAILILIRRTGLGVTQRDA
jgi:O-antigen/teichoic acid export membrane protein